MALWGALVKPSSKEISCKFVVNQLASSLLTTTGNLTSAIGNILPLAGNAGGDGGLLNQIGIKKSKQTEQFSADAVDDEDDDGKLDIGLL